MPSITGGLNGAPAGRFLDVSGWVGVREEESNPVAKHPDLEASLPHPATATRRDVLRSTLIPLQLAGDGDD